MSIDEQIERLIDEKVSQKMKEVELKSFLLKPFFKIDRVAMELDGKSAKWIRENFCLGDQGNELLSRGLIKKVGNEWHFKNPEFFNYVHDEWWVKK